LAPRAGLEPATP